MKKNAVEQGLDPKRASLQPDFVLQELVTAENFIVAIEAVFSNHKEEEDIRKLLKSARQGNTSIEEFNLYFNSLLYSVDLSESLKCEFYNDAINPKIVQLDVLAAQIGFTYEDWKKECILQHLCHRCGGTWDSAHDTVHHCPLAKKHHLSKVQCLAIWKDWGGHVWKEGGSRSSELERPDESKWAPVNLQLGSSRGATSQQPDRLPTSPLPADRFDKGKKRESVSEINQEPMLKKRAGKMKAPDGDGKSRLVTVDAMEADPMSVGDMCFACQLAEMEYSESPVTSSHS
ncbi:hypothetical protein PGTUg99_026465 [Puccinia graminis f. sp. tritici]|uniref:Retrotransposon gag domain-containing protein n=1 Tax=Puccinia graminis f. sp. tritici TaxID=56615 RepID=A0A5B0Q1V6_PUCGR|nr:hypothetical protein PGTUg99_026465 [Puccinia graminis f. sp. tritici]